MEEGNARVSPLHFLAHHPYTYRLLHEGSRYMHTPRIPCPSAVRDDEGPFVLLYLTVMRLDAL